MTVIYVDRKDFEKIKSTGIMEVPQGYYSQCSEGSYESEHTRMDFVSDDRDADELPPFAYWHDLVIVMSGDMICSGADCIYV